LSKETETPDRETLTWAARVWSHLTAVECVGVLHLALRYNLALLESELVREQLRYIDRISLLPWPSLGEPLQHDIARALCGLRKAFAR
jgi:hypothetical protein